MIRCETCGQMKPDEEFPPRKNYTYHSCHECRSKHAVECYHRKREEHRQKMREYKKAHGAKYREGYKAAGEKYERKESATTDMAYVKLAATIISIQTRAFETACRSYDGKERTWYKIRNLEKELCTKYYEIMSMGAIDFTEYCRNIKKKYKVEKPRTLQ